MLACGALLRACLASRPGLYIIVSLGLPLHCPAAAQKVETGAAAFAICPSETVISYNVRLPSDPKPKLQVRPLQSIKSLQLAGWGLCSTKSLQLGGWGPPG